MINLIYTELVKGIINNKLVNADKFARGSGKTTQLINLAYDIDSPVIVANEKAKHSMILYADSINKPIQVQTVQQVLNRGFNKGLVDEGINREDLDTMLKHGLVVGGFLNVDKKEEKEVEEDTVRPLLAKLSITLSDLKHHFGIDDKARIFSVGINEEEAVEIMLAVGSNKTPDPSWSALSVKNVSRFSLINNDIKKNNSDFRYKNSFIFRAKRTLNSNEIKEWLGVESDLVINNVELDESGTNVIITVMTLGEHGSHGLFSSGNLNGLPIHNFVKNKTKNV